MDNMQIALDIAQYSRCKRRKVGVVIVPSRDKGSVVGYNHLPSFIDGSICNNCPREGQKHGDWSGSQDCPVMHAEVDAILRAARCGVNINFSTIYVTEKPCNQCVKWIVEAGITKVVYLKDDGNTEAEEYLRKCGVEVEQYKDPEIIDNPADGECC